MKKFKVYIDYVLLGGLAVMAYVATEPDEKLMSNMAQLSIAGIVTALFAAFAVLVWRENPGDEREAHNQFVASRMAYILGCIVLIVGLIFNTFWHVYDPFIPLALLVMVLTKIMVQKQKDRS